MLRIAVPTNRPQAVVNYLDALAQSNARGTGSGPSCIRRTA